MPTRLMSLLHNKKGQVEQVKKCRVFYVIKCMSTVRDVMNMPDCSEMLQA